uniref:Protein kinase domain-containing protein n=1 Tax=Globisporangium ultimum (strain ATCC 200006 / CBS 805.95 / DAOM BR144) TaxID=431595 RepID=K3WR78_GLOUD
MGLCLSNCMPKGGGNIGEEIEKDLDDVNRSYIKQIDHATPFGTTALLAADEVMCLDVIGEGPFGTVYEGRYRGSTVAVKKMKMTAQPMKPSMRENMEMELQVEAGRMGTLRHPNTVLFMGACVQGEYFCIVSEFCTRGSLYNVLHAPKQTTQSSSGKKDKRGVDGQPLSRNNAPGSNG